MTDAHRWHRVLYVDGGRVRGLDGMLDVAPSRPSLDPFRSWLLLSEIAPGELAFVDEKTGRVVIPQTPPDRRRHGPCRGPSGEQPLKPT
ncbi:MAG: hypothetical protein QOF01_2548 [Thermomicrobiales bacterium]|jgi:hypothetical protein|nr:hypothetical protein [Thermomicrobiales bacterium]